MPGELDRAVGTEGCWESWQEPRGLSETCPGIKIFYFSLLLMIKPNLFYSFFFFFQKLEQHCWGTQEGWGTSVTLTAKVLWDLGLGKCQLL